jgi:Protein of unknown function (DUF2815)
MGIELKLNNVRLAYPNLFVPTSFEDDQEKKYQATLIIKKGSPQHAALTAAVKKAITDTWPDGKPPTLKHCIRDGSEKADKDGFGEDIVFISPKNKKRPTVVDRDRTPLTESDDRPYGGCMVNAIVDVWPQNTPKYKRVNVSLLAIQFYADGDAFGGGRVAKADEFDDISGESAPVNATADDPLFA